tara:strand:- start:686 stop:1981 length:1296 start_codon:yes stop_codon:yes gene_type:complete
MIPKNINRYKFNILDKKIIGIYRKYINKKKISPNSKIFFKNSFLGFVTQLDWCLIEKKIKKDNKLKEIENIFDLLETSEKFISKKTFKTKINNLFKDIFVDLVSIIPFSLGDIYGPGSLEKNIVKRFINNFKYAIFYKKVSKIKLVNVKKNKSFFFKECKKNKVKNYKLIDKFIPDSYFSDLIENNIDKNIRLYASGDILYNINISKIITLKNKIQFTNIVHGGGYYEFKKSLWESSERHLAGNFPKLYLKSLENHTQYKNPKNIKIIYALRSLPRINDKIACPDFYHHLNEKKNFESIKPFIKKYNIKLRPHPRGLHKCYKGLKIIGNSTYNLDSNSIIIFDSISSSLTFWLVANNIPFIHIINKLNLKSLQNRTIKYIKLAEKNNCFLLNKNNQEISLFLNKLNSNKINFEKIIKTNKKLFKDLKYKIN